MLQAIRSKAGSWTVKILFVFLIIAFAGWGIGSTTVDNIMAAFNEQPVAEIGDRDISVQQFNTEFQRFRERSQGQYDAMIRGGMELQLKLTVLQQLVQNAVIEETAADQGLIPGLD